MVMKASAFGTHDERPAPTIFCAIGGAERQNAGLQQRGRVCPQTRSYCVTLRRENPLQFALVGERNC